MASVTFPPLHTAICFAHILSSNLKLAQLVEYKFRSIERDWFRCLGLVLIFWVASFLPWPLDRRSQKEPSYLRYLTQWNFVRRYFRVPGHGSGKLAVNIVHSVLLLHLKRQNLIVILLNPRLRPRSFCRTLPYEGDTKMFDANYIYWWTWHLSWFCISYLNAVYHQGHSV